MLTWRRSLPPRDVSYIFDAEVGNAGHLSTLSCAAAKRRVITSEVTVELPMKGQTSHALNSVPPAKVTHIGTALNREDNLDARILERQTFCQQGIYQRHLHEEQGKRKSIPCQRL